MTALTIGRALLVAGSLVLAPTLTGCADSATGPDEPTASMVLTASVVGTPIQTIVVQVTGPGILTPPTFNINVVGGFATGVIQLPPGANRVITVTAFDSNGDITHEGSKSIPVVRPGDNPPVNIPMIPRQGNVEISVQIGSVSIVLDASALNLLSGHQQQLTAMITAANGDVLDLPVTWATTNPAVARVTDGLVTAVWEGSAQIVATVAGVAAAATIDVPACTITPYSFGTTITGELAATDCRHVPELTLTRNGYIDYYSASLATQTTLLIEQTSVFDTYIYQYDLARTPVAFDDDGGEGLNSSYRIVLAAGDYLLGASAYVATATGTYTFTTTGTSSDNANCVQPAMFLTRGVSTGQVLEATDCSSGALDQYRIIAPAGVPLTIRMQSTTFNTLLQLFGSGVNLSNDDSEGTNSLISYTAPTTRILNIVARSAIAGSTGAYTISVD